jgi:hypothetical protein
VPYAAYEYNNPLMSVQCDLGEGKLTSTMSFLACDGDVIVTAMKPAGFPLAEYALPADGRPETVIVRLYEPTGFPARVELGWFAGLSEAHSTNLLEEPQRKLRLHGDRVRLDLSGFQIETAALRVQPLGFSVGEDDLGRRIEPAQPVYFAHWQHNAGAEPLGYSPIGLSLRGDIKPDTHVPQGWYTVNTMSLGLVNNLTVPVNGQVRFELPQGWRTEPAEVPYQLAPHASATIPVTLVFEDRAVRRGVVKARIEHDGQTYEALLEVGEAARLTWGLKRSDDNVLVRITTDYPQPVTVDAYVVVPHELWGDVVEGAKLGTVAPRYQRLVIPAGGEVVLRIGAAPRVDAWLTIKLAYHGRVEYKQVRLPGP